MSRATPNMMIARQIFSAVRLPEEKLMEIGSVGKIRSLENKDTGFVQITTSSGCPDFFRTIYQLTDRLLPQRQPPVDHTAHFLHARHDPLPIQILV